MPASFKLDRTAFKIVSFNEKGLNRDYWLSKSVFDRLSASWYLTCQAYNLDYYKHQPLDRTSFSIRKRN